MDTMGFFIGGIIFGILAGVAIGFALGTHSQVETILTLLKDFKSEGHDNKWLK